MLLAAGRGARMRPLTDRTPKPLLPVGGKPLIVWHIERLRDAGIRELVINHAHLGEQLVATLGDGNRLGVDIAWSAEPPGALETAGGIRQALPLLGDAPFLALAADIWCDWPPASAAVIAEQLRQNTSAAHLVLITNPAHHPEGDFAFDGHCLGRGEQRLTFSGIALFRPDFFSDLTPGQPMRLAPLLHRAAAQGRLSGEQHAGQWVDVGTPERLHQLDAHLRRLST